ncbi:hypothetical protein ACFQ1S_20495 [Kibdelosporangium lantanae]|uniref:Uncharacterized protein n=1 Tax=Kibdelosporangium lantanae TaxID=1497396 RepID=A0ABW3MDN7_9PSEU
MSVEPCVQRGGVWYLFLYDVVGVLPKGPGTSGGCSGDTGVDGVPAWLAQCEELVVQLQVRELEAGDPMDGGDGQVQRVSQLLGKWVGGWRVTCRSRRGGR